MVGGAHLPVQGLGDKHLARHRVDAEHLIGGLVRPHPGDAVPDGDVPVLVRADLHTQSTTQQLVNIQSIIYFSVIKQTLLSETAG